MLAGRDRGHRKRNRADTLLAFGDPEHGRRGALGAAPAWNWAAMLLGDPQDSGSIGVKQRAMGAAMRQGVGVALVAAGLLCMPEFASAQAVPEKAIRARQSSYYLMGQEMSRINAMLKGDLAFDKSTLETSAEAVELIGRIVVDYYPAGSDQGTTKAKPEIWKETPRFKQLAQALQSESVKLKAAVHGGDRDAIRAAYGATSKSCKACHDAYRAQ
jgi:cytochrome c556